MIRSCKQAARGRNEAAVETRVEAQVCVLGPKDLLYWTLNRTLEFHFSDMATRQLEWPLSSWKRCSF